MKALRLLQKGEFQTFYKRMNVVFNPMAAAVAIDVDIQPNFRPEASFPQFSIQFSIQNGSKKVFVVDRNFERLGSHISLSEIIVPLQDRLKDENIDIHLACLDPRGNLTKAYEEKFEIHEFRHFPENMSLIDKYEREVAALAGELSSFEPDLIYANSVDMFPVIDAARISGIPTIWNIREAQEWRLRFADRHPKIVARALACFAYPERTIFVSQSSAENWKEFVGFDNSCVIRTAVKPDFFVNPNLSEASDIRLKLGIPKDAIMLLTVGTICTDKGQLDAAHAMKVIPEELRDKIHWVFIGNSDGAYLRKLKQTWPKLHSRNNLHLCGHVSDCTPYYYAANALVSCSHTEALPRNILEGKLAGLPIISSNIPGSVEAVAGYELASFYDLKDANGLSLQIEQLENQCSLTQRIKIESAFSEYESMVSKYSERITNILES